MIITKQKPIETILEYTKEDSKIFLVGCSECATICKTGGEDALKAMTELLSKHGKTITGSCILEPCCYALEAKKKFQENKDKILDSNAILVLSCGDGVQTVRKVFKKLTHPALDTLFLGERIRGNVFEEACSLCGDCIIDETGGLCPVTLCSKGLLNGPCGGSKNEKCEVDSNRDCGWILIYKNLKELKRIDKLKKIQPPKDYLKSIKPRNLTI